MATIDVNGTAIAYRRAGAGEPVILLHSSTGSGAQWDALVEDLRRDFLVLAPDLHGYGESDGWPGAHRLSLGDEAAIVEALAATCAGPVHLVGHSYGGAVALKAALRGKAAPRSLSLVEPAAFHLLENSDPWGERYLEPIREVAGDVRSAISRGDRNRAMHRFIDFWSGPGAWESLSPGRQSRVTSVASKVPLDFAAAMTDTATLKDCAALDLPTLLLCGTVSPAPMRRIVALLDIVFHGSALSVITGAGHMLPLTHPQPVNQAIAAHLRRYRAVPRLAA